MTEWQWLMVKSSRYFHHVQHVPKSRTIAENKRVNCEIMLNVGDKISLRHHGELPSMKHGKFPLPSKVNRATGLEGDYRNVYLNISGLDGLNMLNFSPS